MYYGGAPCYPPAEYAGMSQATIQALFESKQALLQRLVSDQQIMNAAYTQGDGSKSISYNNTNDKQIDALRQDLRTLAYILGLGPRRRALRMGF
jgi:AcrR family transcriptional regulator